MEDDSKTAYDKALSDLVAALQKKRAIDKSLVSLETNLYNFEGSYLQDTANSGGNIIQGFEGYLKNAPNNRRKAEANLDNDRVFSNSSTTYLRALEINQDDPMDPPTPSLSTVALGGSLGDLRRDSRPGRGQRKRTEDPEFIPPTSATSTVRAGRPTKRQKGIDD